jgi:hypothetical protein
MLPQTPIRYLELEMKFGSMDIHFGRRSSCPGLCPMNSIRQDTFPIKYKTGLVAIKII